MAKVSYKAKPSIKARSPLANAYHAKRKIAAMAGKITSGDVASADALATEIRQTMGNPIPPEERVRLKYDFDNQCKKLELLRSKPNNPNNPNNPKPSEPSSPPAHGQTRLFDSIDGVADTMDEGYWEKYDSSKRTSIIKDQGSVKRFAGKMFSGKSKDKLMKKYKFKINTVNECCTGTGAVAIGLTPALGIKKKKKLNGPKGLKGIGSKTVKGVIGTANRGIGNSMG